MAISTIAIIASICAAVLSGIVSVCKLVDRKRQKCVPSRYQFVKATLRAATEAAKSDFPLLASQEVSTAERPAPLMAGRPTERVARFEDIAPKLESGDIGTFSGRSVFAFVIRFLCYSDKSHVFMIDRDDEGLWILDSCEGRGITRRPLLEEVRNYPGQVYVSRIAWPYRKHYKRHLAMEYARSMLGQRYGKLIVLFQSIIHAPFIRVFAYITSLDRLFAHAMPVCSGFGTRVLRHGQLDPIPHRDEQLITPQDFAQSMVAEEWISVLP